MNTLCWLLTSMCVWGEERVNDELLTVRRNLDVSDYPSDKEKEEQEMKKLLTVYRRHSVWIQTPPLSRTLTHTLTTGTLKNTTSFSTWEDTVNNLFWFISICAFIHPYDWIWLRMNTWENKRRTRIYPLNAEHTHTHKDGGRRVRLLDYPEEKVLVFELKANGFDGSVSGL